MLIAFWLWLLAAVLAALAAWASGARPGDVGGGVALAAAPAFAGFLLAPRVERRRVAFGLLATWWLMGLGLAAASGGAGSPAIAALLIPPALAIALGRPWVPEAGAAAMLGAPVAEFLSGYRGPMALGVYPEAIAIVSLGFAAGLIGVGASRRGAIESGAADRIAEVSHELRTPLTHILGFSEMIERQVFGAIGERYVEYAGLIRRSGAHLLSLVNDLLDMSKIEAGRYPLEMERFDARDIAEEVVRLSRDAAEKKSISLTLQAPNEAVPVRADSQALRRMLTNTVANALKFTPEAGKVSVKLAANDGALEFEVADTGPGFSGNLGDFGQKYLRGGGGENAEGAGLGLYLVRSLATLHGGELNLENASGGGALVRVRLPVLE